MDKLHAVRCFCRVVEAKSFAAAAQALRVVPSGLSKTIAALERELGFRLLNRSTRRLSLTHEGEVYYEQCRSLMQGLEEAEATARSGGTQAQGNLRIGIHPGLRVVVFGSFGRFLHNNPGLKIETVVTNSASAVLDEGLDLVVRIGRLPDSGLIARRLGVVRSIACAAPSYLQAFGEPVHPLDLANFQAIIYGRRDEVSNADWTFTKAHDRVTVSVPVRLVLRDGIGVTDAAVGGCGVALPFDISVRHLLRSGLLCPLLSKWSGEQQPVFAVMPSGRGSGLAKVRACLEFLESILEL